ncbi:MAG: hypothetical protein JW969_18790 [Spirochaetales bacterium]|nr:hypothetical protein [Spirochaetales bacterium]
MKSGAALNHYDNHILPIEKLGAGQAQIFGGKASALGQCLGKGLSVPGGIALSSGIFADFLFRNGFPFSLKQYAADGCPGQAYTYFRKTLTFTKTAWRLHWEAVWGLAYAEGWEAEGLDTFPRYLSGLGIVLPAHDLFDLLYSPTAFTRLREMFGKITWFINSHPRLKARLREDTYPSVQYASLSRSFAGRRLKRMIRSLVRRYPFHPTKDWVEPFAPVIRERPWAVFELIRSAAGTDPDRSRAARKGILKSKRRIASVILKKLPLRE